MSYFVSQLLCRAIKLLKDYTSVVNNSLKIQIILHYCIQLFRLVTMSVQYRNTAEIEN